MPDHLHELVREFLSGGAGGFVAYWFHQLHHRIYHRLHRSIFNLIGKR